MNLPLLIGHRGAAGIVAENTLASIQKALDCGVAGVELDVHCCKSGELVVIHDYKVDRTTNGTGKVRKMPLQELQALEVIGGYKIPTLMEVLELIQGRCMVNIELKGKKTARAVVQCIWEALRTKAWQQEHFIVSSFDWEQLKKVRKLDAKLRIGILKEGKLKRAFKMAKKLNAYSIHPDYRYLKQHHMWRAARRNLAIFPWTVNEKNDFRQMQAYQVTGIMTDFPDRYASV